MWTRRGHPSTTADMVLSWGEILYRASVMLAGLIIVLAAINGLYQVSILEEPDHPGRAVRRRRSDLADRIFLPPDIAVTSA